MRIFGKFRMDTEAFDTELFLDEIEKRPKK